MKETIWKLVTLPESDGGIRTIENVTVIVNTDDPDVIEAIERAAAVQGVEIVRA